MRHPTRRQPDWEGVDDKLRARLAEIGLAAPKIVPKRLALGDLVAMYKERPKWRDKQPSTQQNYDMHFRHIFAAMGAETHVDAVTETAADDLPSGLPVGRDMDGRPWPPVELTNVNNVLYREDGVLVALGYDGNVHLLTDTDGDGLEDHASLFWENAVATAIAAACTQRNLSCARHTG